MSAQPSQLDRKRVRPDPPVSTTELEQQVADVFESLDATFSLFKYQLRAAVHSPESSRDFPAFDFYTGAIGTYLEDLLDLRALHESKVNTRLAHRLNLLLRRCQVPPDEKDLDLVAEVRLSLGVADDDESDEASLPATQEIIDSEEDTDVNVDSDDCVVLPVTICTHMSKDYPRPSVKVFPSKSNLSLKESTSSL